MDCNLPFSRMTSCFDRASADDATPVTPRNRLLRVSAIFRKFTPPQRPAHLHEEDNVLLYIFCIPLEEHHITLET